MMDGAYGMGWGWFMSLPGLLVLVLAVLGIAVAIKYLASGR